MCLLTLKHLVSLQARVRSSVQVELDLHITLQQIDERREIEKKENVIFVPFNVSTPPL